MGKLLKHFKPAIIPILFTIMLLAVQAYCDLSLPTYMSNIVNVGIQQAGIDCVTPDKSPKEEIDKIQLFMNSRERDFVSSCYTEDTYKNNDILVLKDLSEKDSAKLAKTLEKPMLITYIMEMSQKGKLSKDSVSGEIDTESFNKIMENGVKDMTPENQMTARIKRILTCLKYFPYSAKIQGKKLLKQ